MVRHTLIELAKALNEMDVVWGLGGSFLLKMYGIDINPRDIDILVCEDDIGKVNDIMKQKGTEIVMEKHHLYETEHFNRYDVNGVEVDVMSNFQVNCGNSIYMYPFSKDELTYVVMEDVTIPLCSLSEWKTAYEKMGRLKKVSMISDFIRLSS